MEFWGLEVEPGQSVKVNPGENKYLHLSQVSLGEVKKEKATEGTSVFVKFDDKKLVLGTLSADKCNQIQYDLVFEKEFELSHGSKNTSVYFLGYKTAAFEENDDISDSSNSESESDKEIPLAVPINGKPEVKAKAAKPNTQKPETSAGKSKVKVEELKKDDKSKAEDDEDDDDSDDDSEDESDEEMIDGEDDSDDEDESSDEEEDATPKKAEASKKRLADSASKTPVPEKKAKLVSPGGNQKTAADGKKVVHVATPHPAKQGKTPANSSDKSKQQTPKSTGPVACKSCSKTFNSDNALQSHTKAKHSTGN